MDFLGFLTGSDTILPIKVGDCAPVVEYQTAVLRGEMDVQVAEDPGSSLPRLQILDFWTPIRMSIRYGVSSSC